MAGLRNLPANTARTRNSEVVLQSGERITILGLSTGEVLDQLLDGANKIEQRSV